MFVLQDISYTHSNKDLLFANISLTVNNHDKIALIGNNGVGKSTLLKIIAKDITPSHGQLISEVWPYYVPQVFGQFNHLTIAKALQVEDKLNALQKILSGDVTIENTTALNDDWTIDERCHNALHYWQLDDLDLSQRMETLSGGQKTKVFLAGISIHQPELILLDEPSNHLDFEGRQLLYDFIESTQSTLVIVSHDRKLLNLLNTVCELKSNELSRYGGNYDFYLNQKEIERTALNLDIQAKEKELRKAKERERETIERQQKLDSRGKRKQEKAGVARIMMNTLRNNAENSTSRLKGIHADKISGLANDLSDLRSKLPDIDQMKFGLSTNVVHPGKVLFKATDINFKYTDKPLWHKSLNIRITSGERISIKGRNGSGKTTLIKLLLGELVPHMGTVSLFTNNCIYVDQDYSLIDNTLNIFQQAQFFNNSALPEHEVKIRLNRFLFTRDVWDNTCASLSGGERMRLTLCCLTIRSQSPDVLILDEPTNNLDLQNIEILTAAINQFRGTLLVISHDETFLKQVDIGETLSLS